MGSRNRWRAGNTAVIVIIPRVAVNIASYERPGVTVIIGECADRVTCVVSYLHINTSATGGVYPGGAYGSIAGGGSCIGSGYNSDLRNRCSEWYGDLTMCRCAN